MRLVKLPPSLVAASLAAVVLSAACADDPVVVPPSSVAGTYHATTFTVSSAGSTANLLASGASLIVTLGIDHTTTGRLLIPAAAAGGTAVDENLAGSWRQSHDTVYFAGSADTFLRDMPFVVVGRTLAGDATFADERVQVTLSTYGLD